jgi:hypothetical protein
LFEEGAREVFKGRYGGVGSAMTAALALKSACATVEKATSPPALFSFQG